MTRAPEIPAGQAATEAVPNVFAHAFPTADSAIPGVREFADDAFTAWGLDLENTVVTDAVQVVSELCANAARHARALCAMADLEIRFNGCAITIQVHDRHPHIPSVLITPEGAVAPRNDDGAEGGWGLLIVKELAYAVAGSFEIRRDPDGRGKTIEVILPVITVPTPLRRPEPP